MAEVRKHRPRSTGSIGDQVRANIGAGPRPVTPGEEDSAPIYDPFVDAEAEHAAAVSDVPTSFAVTDLGTEGWFSFGQDAVTQLAQASRPATETDDQDDEDDEDQD